MANRINITDPTETPRGIAFKPVIHAALALLLASSAAAQEAIPAKAPINPLFSPYAAYSSALTSDKRLGHRAAPVSSSHIRKSAIRAAAMAASPKTYAASFDLRDSGKVSAVKNQGSCGACWAFASMASLESNLLSSESWDFSENNMKNTHGYDWGHCDGGHAYISMAYLNRWSGPVTESDDPYSQYSGVSPSNLTVRKHMQEVLILPPRSGPLDNDDIKEALTTMGAVDAAMYWDDAYYKAATYSYYYNGSADSNHDITIVGWDDNYNKSNFTPVPAGNGAFLVKNSWSSSWGQSGYFWLSYYDSRIGSECFVFNNAQTTANYTRIDQYDPLGWVSSIGYSGSTAWMANIFTAPSSGETIKAAGFYTVNSDISYEMRVYVNVTAGAPTSGTLSYTKTGSFAYAGFHTIAVPDVVVSPGQRFSIVVKMTGDTYPLPIEDRIAGYTSAATASPGQSYVSANGSSWSDLTSSYSNANACIKAYSNTNGPALSSITPSSGMRGNTVSITNLAGSGLLAGSTVKLYRAGQSDINASNVAVVASNKITCDFALPANTALGAWNVSVTSGSQVASLAGAFSVLSLPPDITTAYPASSLSTGTLTGFTITGTNFRTGAAVKLTQSGANDVNATNIVVASDNKTITCDLPINGINKGYWNVVVTNTDDGQSDTLSNGFNALWPDAPNLVSVSPATAITGENVTLSLTGTKFRSTVAASLVNSADYSTITTSTTVISETQLSCSANLTGAATGLWNVQVKDEFDQISSLQKGFSVTLPPPTLQMVTPSTGTNIGNAPVTIRGTNFYGSTAKLARSGQTAIASIADTLSGLTQLSSVFPLTGAQSGDWDLVLTNSDGQSVTMPNAFTVVQAATATVTAGSAATITFPYSTTQIELEIPAGAFSQSVTISMATPNGSTPQENSKAGVLSPTDVAIQITTSQNLQPSAPVQLKMGYTPADISGKDENRLLVARYDEDKSLWIPLQSSVDTAARTVTASVSHFSLFRIMQAAAATDLAAMKCFPNPMRPARGATYAKMNFTALPTGATIKIYTFAGELARTLSPDSSGMAVWDGKNNAGQNMASGVYLALIEYSGTKKVLKVAIER